MMALRLLVTGVVIVTMGAGAAGAADLPLRHVVLFSSGVGFFEHQGLVHGNQTVTMSFRAEQINDILKSMVLQDHSGGTIGPVTYAPRDPLERTLRSFAVDIGDEPPLGELLSRLRGADVRIRTSEGEAVGTVLGTEWQEKSVEDQILRFEVVNLVSQGGMRQIPIWHIDSVALVSDDLSDDLRKALEAIAANRDVSKRQVELHFNGEGARTVSVGYLLETPVWKTSYRLVVDEGESFLQGWAIVENTTDEDWEAVDLALVSGRPVSFTQDLYEPIYVDRPEVPVQTQIAARPRRYEGALEEAEEPEMVAGSERRALMARAAPAAAPGMMAGEAAAGAGFGTALSVDALAAAGVAAAAAGEEVGEMFHYAISQPISISRQGSAMIPIVNQPIETEKLSIYNPQDNAKYPMHGLRIRNSTGLALMGGAITVFEGGAYAGDALIEDLGRGDERLVSYAVDLGIEVDPEHTGGDRLQEAVKIVRGVLQVTLKESAEVVYTVKSRAESARTVLIEHPRREGWELVQPAQAEETTRNLYRLKLEVAPGASEKLVVREEHQLTEAVALTTENLDRIAIYMRGRNVSDAVKQALQRIIEMKQQIAQIDQQIADKEARLTQISEEQDRIRQNMEQLDHDSELYQRYVQKFGEQEDEFDKIRGEIATLKEQRNGLQRELEAYVISLNVE
ncbi:MAG: hypothetical protein AB7Y46_00370 [Armatimonadota bacterium]